MLSNFEKAITVIAMLIFTVITGYVMLAPIFQPYETVCEPGQIISLEKSIIEQKYAAEVKLPEETTIIYTSADTYASLQAGEAVNVCHDEGKWIPDNRNQILWIEEK